MIKKYLFLCIVFLSFAFEINANFIGDAALLDTIPTRKDYYHGYRLYLSSIRKVKQRKNTITISFSLTNTGKKDVDLSSGEKSLIVIKSDNSCEISGLSKHNELIKLSVLTDLNIFIPAGATKQNIFLDIYLQEQKITKKSSGFFAKLRKKIRKKRLEKKIKKKKKIKKPKKTKKPEKIKKPEKTKKAKKTKKPKKIKKPEKTKKAKKTKKPKKSKKTKKTKKPEKVKKKKSKKKSSKTKSFPNTKEFCPDLVFDTVKVIKRKKRWIYLELTIKNVGKGPANLLGSDDNAEDNIAIRGYVSGTRKLSRGAIVLGGMFFKRNRKNEEKNILYPGESIVTQFKLDITPKTRYLNVLILSIDAFQSLYECDKKNNTAFLLL